MRAHSALLGQDWSEVDSYRPLVERTVVRRRVPAYFRETLHGLEGGGLSPEQALQQSASMRYIMRTFQGDSQFRERAMRDRLHELDRVGVRFAIDLGSGTGDSTLALKRELPDAAVAGVDLSEYMVNLALARAKARECPVLFVVGDAARLPFADASADLVTSFAMLHEMPRAHAELVVREAARVLRPGGWLLLWDQAVSPWALRMQIRGIEPFLSEYAQLNLTALLREHRFSNLREETHGNIRFWGGMR